MDEVQHKAISHESKAFDIPLHRGSCPSKVSADEATREKEVAKHKAKVHQCETCKSVHDILKQKAIEGVD